MVQIARFGVKVTSPFAPRKDVPSRSERRRRDLRASTAATLNCNILINHAGFEPALHAGCRGFESLIAHLSTIKKRRYGSIDFEQKRMRTTQALSAIQALADRRKRVGRSSSRREAWRTVSPRQTPSEKTEFVHICLYSVEFRFGA